MFNINRYIKKLACSVFAASAAVLQIKHLSAKKFGKCAVIVYNRDLYAKQDGNGNENVTKQKV